MGRVQPNRERYLQSLANELSTQANRVRDLIGSAHWLSDGHHKEYLLIDLLRRHIPSGIIASRGFVISPSISELCSKEQDILLVDTSHEAPVFNQGGLLIAFPHSVRAAISVKTKMESDSIQDSVEGLGTVRTLAAIHLSDPRILWCGAYYFEASDSIINSPVNVFDQIKRSMSRYPVRSPITVIRLSTLHRSVRTSIAPLMSFCSNSTTVITAILKP